MGDEYREFSKVIGIMQYNIYTLNNGDSDDNVARVLQVAEEIMTLAKDRWGFLPVEALHNPGITISVPLGRVTIPVTSVVLK